MSDVTTYFWVVYYDAEAGTAARPAPGREPPRAAPADMVPKFISVVHRNLVSTFETEYDMARAGLPDDPRYYKGRKESRVEAVDFHPSEKDAIDWINQNWPALQQKGAVYAEVHSFRVSFRALAGSTGPL